MRNQTCPFCDITDRIRRTVAETERSVAVSDNYPVSDGHTLLIPKHHVSSLFDLSEEETLDLYRLLLNVRLVLQDQFGPDGFNVGVNDGKAAGQTIPHVHVHVIPRYVGDVQDPAGGIRHILTSKVPYP